MKKTFKYCLMLAVTVAAFASCSKIEEDERIERIPLPQAQIDTDTDWNTVDVEHKTHQ